MLCDNERCDENFPGDYTGLDTNFVQQEVHVVPPSCISYDNGTLAAPFMYSPLDLISFHQFLNEVSLRRAFMRM